MTYIPERYRRLCHYCELDLDIRAAGIFQYTKGWVMNREGGGGHGVSLPERENRWAHKFCVERAVRGTLGQVEMFS